MCANKMNKKGDLYLPCIAMAHSPKVIVDIGPVPEKFESVHWECMSHYPGAGDGNEYGFCVILTMIYLQNICQKILE